MADDPLADFGVTTFTHSGSTRDVYRRGEGPAVIVMAELPGITPKVADFARRVSDLGCTAVMPQLFGEPGRDPDPAAHGPLGAAGTFLRGAVPPCVSREFVVWATGRTSPVVTWLRALAAHEHERCGGPGVGAVGMCFTGGFALAMATDPRLVAPVLSQPSLPFAVGGRRSRNIDTSPEDLELVRQRCAAEEGFEVLGLRFRGDRFVPAERFGFLREQLGESFVAIELDDEDAAPEAPMAPHSVLTEHLVDEEGEPTRVALDRVLEHFRTHLLVAG
ncbi:MAG: dienelactone hydrolase family protein [Microthrixaceae bacterium]